MSKINIKLVGTVVEFKFSHNHKGHDIYKGVIAVKRNSGIVDSIPFMTADNDLTGVSRIEIDGKIRTYSYLGQDGKTHKNMVVMAVSASNTSKPYDFNYARIEGTIVKTLPVRETPLGRKICDFVIATNYNFKKSAYINAIAWGAAGERISSMSVGDKKIFYGRFQSRKYTKITDSGSVEVRTAYEISTAQFEDIEYDTCCD